MTLGMILITTFGEEQLEELKCTIASQFSKSMILIEDGLVICDLESDFNEQCVQQLL